MAVDIFDNDDRNGRSTTSPIASTIARRVSRLRLNPIAAIKVPAPISDSGIVTIGITTERTLPRNRKITTTTMTTAWPRLILTSSIEAWMNFVES